MRLYPSANPQVQRSNDFFFKAFQALAAHEADGSVTIACSDGRLLICGEHLSDRDLSRPQIQGLITLFNRLQVHSFTFQARFSPKDCSTFIQLMSSLMGEKEVSESIAALLNKAGITSVAADAKRYVAIREGEQVVREELIGSGLNISDEELTNFVLGKSAQESVSGISAELVQELINRLPVADEVSRQHPEEVSKAVIDFLQHLSRETNTTAHSQEITNSAKALANLEPSVLARLVAQLPATSDADAVLGATLNQMSPQHLTHLIANLTLQQPSFAQAGTAQPSATINNPLARLANLEQARTHEITKAIAQNIDARQLLLNPDTTISQLPDHLLHMLGHYEQLLSKEQQTQVARQAGAQLASMEGIALGNILAQKFKGLFGEQLYSQVINQVSDELLDETIEHLTPKQLNRMIATLTSDIPLQIGKDKDPDFKPADDTVLKRLTQTRKGTRR